MSFIDILFLVIVVACVGLSFVGRFFTKVVKTGAMIAAVIFAAIGASKAGASLLTSTVTVEGVGDVALVDYVNNLVTTQMQGFNINPDVILGMIKVVFSVISFWAIAIVLFLVFGLISTIVCAIVFKPMKKGTAVKQFGLLGLVKGVVIATALVFPVLVCAPIVSAVSNLDTTGETTQDLKPVVDELESSFVVKVSNKILKKVQPSILKYEVDGEKRYIYDDISAISSLSKIASVVTDLESADADTIVASLSEMEDEEVVELFQAIEESDTAKEIIVGVLEQIELPEGVDVDFSKMDLTNEADLFIVVKNAVTVDGEGEAQFDPSKLDVNEVVDAVAKSDIAVVLAASAPGMLSGVDESTKTQIETLLQSKVTDGTMSQEKLDELMKLFETK